MSHFRMKPTKGLCIDVQTTRRTERDIVTTDIRFTPTQQRMVDLLADGLPHPRQQLRECLYDELSEFSVVQNHISDIRKKLLLRGEYIVCELRGYQICYRHVRLLHSNVYSSQEKSRVNNRNFS